MTALVADLAGLLGCVAGSPQHAMVDSGADFALLISIDNGELDIKNVQKVRKESTTASFYNIVTLDSRNCL